MSDVEFALDQTVWNLAARMAAALDDLDEGAGDAVWFQAAGGRCAFIAQAPSATVMVFGGVWHGPDLDIALSPRFVWFVGMHAADDEPASVRLVDGVTAVFERDGLQAAIDLVDASEPPDIPDVPVAADASAIQAGAAPAASAVMSASRLQQAINLARTAPRGVDLDAFPQPPMWLSLEPNDSISLHVDWSSRGPGRSTYRTTAVHVAGRGAVSVSSGALLSLLVNLDVDEDDVVLTLPQDRGDPMLLQTDAWCAWLPCADATVARWQPELVAHLRAARLAHEVVDERVLLIGDVDTLVRAELHGGSSETLRLTIVIATGVLLNAQVLVELNQANMGLVGVRLWVDDDRVVAGTDLPCERLSDTAATLASLRRQTDGLGVFLGALA